MSYRVFSRTGDRYLGNSNTREVHDLIHEDASPRACQIDEVIAAGYAVGFSPDTLDQAHVEGYDNCHYCIGELMR
ncbi:MAG: hypothetical protein GTO22_03620 [Gemmatimonadales bacterium]|nr:hypothetical protein [Gemmatimonadales bacterium]